MADMDTSSSTAWSSCVRDSRIAMIYEGANGIQALDLVGRMTSEGLSWGRASQAFFRRGFRIPHEEFGARGHEVLYGSAR